MDTQATAVETEKTEPLVRGAPLPIAWESIFRPGESVFHLTLDGGLQPLNPAAHGLASGWTDEDVALFREAVIDADKTAHQTVDELVIGQGGALSRLQVMSLRLATGRGLICVARDISLERELYLALAESRRRYRDFAALSTTLAWETGPDGRFTFISVAGGLGFSADELMALDPMSLIAEAHDTEGSPFSGQAHVDRRELWLWRKDGEIAAVELSSIPLFAADGTPSGARGLCSDVTELRLSQSASQRTRTQIDAMMDIARLQIAPASDSAQSLTDMARRIFGADGVQLATGNSNAWRLAAQSGSAEALAVSGSDPLHRALGQADIISVAHRGWRVLIIPLPTETARTAALLLWRRGTFGPWPTESRQLADALRDMLAIQTVRILNRDSSCDHAAPQDGRDRASNTFLRRIRRSLFAGNESALITYSFGGTNDSSDHPSLEKITQRLRAGLSEFVRGCDFVIALEPGELAIWIDRIGPDTARSRADQLGEDLASRLRVCLEFEGAVPVASQVVPISPAQVQDPDAFVAAVCTRRGRFNNRASQHLPMTVSTPR